MHTRRPFKVMVCAVTLVAFLVNIVSYDIAWADRTPSALTIVGADRAVSPVSPGALKELNVKTFVLPQYLGTVKDSWQPPVIARSAIGATKQSQSRTTVIHIQDAHCNYYAQHAIADIVEYLSKEYGISQINLEGGAKDYDLSIFTSIADKNLRQRVADHFVKEGVVNGAEYFALNNPEKVTLWGIEEPKLYIENLKAYRDSLKYKDDTDKLLKNLSYMLTALKMKIYSKELMSLDYKYSQYKAGNIDFKDYLNYLLANAKDKLVEIKSFSNIFLLNQALKEEGEIDFTKTNNQRDELIDKLQKRLSRNALKELVAKAVEMKAERIPPEEFYRYLINKAKDANMSVENYPELEKYIVYVSSYAAVDKSKVIDEVAALENRIRELLYRNDKERQLDRLSRDLAILKNIFNISLTRDDYKYYKANEPAFDTRNYVKFIEREAPLCGVTAKLDDGITRLDGYREDISKFYEYSFKRDAAFMKNLVIARSAEGTTKQSQKAAIVITGGFHTENLTEQFRKNNIAYISIIPNFRIQDGYQCPYFKILSGEKSLLLKQAVPAMLASSALATLDQLNPRIMQAAAEAGLAKPLPEEIDKNTLARIVRTKKMAEAISAMKIGNKSVAEEAGKEAESVDNGKAAEIAKSGVTLDELAGLEGAVSKRDAFDIMAVIGGKKPATLVSSRNSALPGAVLNKLGLRQVASKKSVSLETKTGEEEVYSIILYNPAEIKGMMRKDHKFIADSLPDMKEADAIRALIQRKGDELSDDDARSVLQFIVDNPVDVYIEGLFYGYPRSAVQWVVKNGLSSISASRGRFSLLDISIEMGLDEDLRPFAGLVVFSPESAVEGLLMAARFKSSYLTYRQAVELLREKAAVAQATTPSAAPEPAAAQVANTAVSEPSISMLIFELGINSRSSARMGIMPDAFTKLTKEGGIISLTAQNGDYPRDVFERNGETKDSGLRIFHIGERGFAMADADRYPDGTMSTTGLIACSGICVKAAGADGHTYYGIAHIFHESNDNANLAFDIAQVSAELIKNGFRNIQYIVSYNPEAYGVDAQNAAAISGLEASIQKQFKVPVKFDQRRDGYFNIAIQNNRVVIIPADSHPSQDPKILKWDVQKAPVVAPEPAAAVPPGVILIKPGDIGRSRDSDGLSSEDTLRILGSDGLDILTPAIERGLREKGPAESVEAVRVLARENKDKIYRFLLKNPVVVSRSNNGRVKYRIENGNNRFSLAELAGIPAVPAVERDEVTLAAQSPTPPEPAAEGIAEIEGLLKILTDRNADQRAKEALKKLSENRSYDNAYTAAKHLLMNGTQNVEQVLKRLFGPNGEASEEYLGELVSAYAMERAVKYSKITSMSNEEFGSEIDFILDVNRAKYGENNKGSDELEDGAYIVESKTEGMRTNLDVIHDQLLKHSMPSDITKEQLISRRNKTKLENYTLNALRMRDANNNVAGIIFAISGDAVAEERIKQFKRSKLEPEAAVAQFKLTMHEAYIPDAVVSKTIENGKLSPRDLKYVKGQIKSLEDEGNIDRSRHGEFYGILENAVARDGATGVQFTITQILKDAGARQKKDQTPAHWEAVFKALAAEVKPTVPWQIIGDSRNYPGYVDIRFTGKHGSTISFNKSIWNSMSDGHRRFFTEVITSDEDTRQKLADANRTKLVFPTSDDPSVQGDGRTIYMRLDAAVTVDGRQIGILRIKGSRLRFEQDGSIASYKGPGQPKRWMSIEDAQIHMNMPGENPVGGMRLAKAEREFEMTRELSASNIPCDIPAGLGRYDGIKFNGNGVGYMVAGLEGEDTRLRFSTEDGVYLVAANLMDKSLRSEQLQAEQIYEMIGKVYRKLHDSGYTHFSPHLGNMGIVKTARGFEIRLRDLESVTRPEPGDKLEQRAALRFPDIERLLYDIATLKEVKIVYDGEVDTELVNTYRLIGPFLRGYFHDLDAAYLDAIEKSVKTPLFVQTIDDLFNNGQGAYPLMRDREPFGSIVIALREVAGKSQSPVAAVAPQVLPAGRGYAQDLARSAASGGFKKVCDIFDALPVDDIIKQISGLGDPSLSDIAQGKITLGDVAIRLAPADNDVTQAMEIDGKQVIQISEKEVRGLIDYLKTRDSDYPEAEADIIKLMLAHELAEMKAAAYGPPRGEKITEADSQQVAFLVEAVARKELKIAESAKEALWLARETRLNMRPEIREITEPSTNVPYADTPSNIADLGIKGQCVFSVEVNGPALAPLKFEDTLAYIADGLIKQLGIDSGDVQHRVNAICIEALTNARKAMERALLSEAYGGYNNYKEKEMNDEFSAEERLRNAEYAKLGLAETLCAVLGYKNTDGTFTILVVNNNQANADLWNLMSKSLGLAESVKTDSGAFANAPDEADYNGVISAGIGLGVLKGRIEATGGSVMPYNGQRYTALRMTMPLGQTAVQSAAPAETIESLLENAVQAAKMPGQTEQQLVGNLTYAIYDVIAKHGELDGHTIVYLAGGIDALPAAAGTPTIIVDNWSKELGRNLPEDARRMLTDIGKDVNVDGRLIYLTGDARQAKVLREARQEIKTPKVTVLLKGAAEYIVSSREYGPEERREYARKLIDDILRELSPDQFIILDTTDRFYFLKYLSEKGYGQVTCNWDVPPVNEAYGGRNGVYFGKVKFLYPTCVTIAKRSGEVNAVVPAPSITQEFAGNDMFKLLSDFAELGINRSNIPDSPEEIEKAAHNEKDLMKRLTELVDRWHKLTDMYHEEVAVYYEPGEHSVYIHNTSGDYIVNMNKVAEITGNALFQRVDIHDMKDNTAVATTSETAIAITENEPLMAAQAKTANAVQANIARIYRNYIVGFVSKDDREDKGRRGPLGRKMIGLYKETDGAVTTAEYYEYADGDTEETFKNNIRLTLKKIVEDMGGVNPVLDPRVALYVPNSLFKTAGATVEELLREPEFGRLRITNREGKEASRVAVLSDTVPLKNEGKIAEAQHIDFGVEWLDYLRHIDTYDQNQKRELADHARICAANPDVIGSMSPEEVLRGIMNGTIVLRMIGPANWDELDKEQARYRKLRESA